MSLGINIEATTTKVFQWIYDLITNSPKKVIINRGGTSSSKTVSALQVLVIMSFQEKNKRYLITTDTLPNLKSGALVDLKNILGYDEETKFGWNIEQFFKWHQSDKYFENTITKTRIYYRGIIDEKDAKGPRYHTIYMNEADRQPYSVFRQLIMRCQGKMLIDFNPSDENVWINERLEKSDRKDVAVFKTSYLDNKFLPKHIVQEIELLKATDPIFWKIYGLGEYGNLSGKIYENIQVVDYFPSKDYCIGIDYGASTTAVVKCHVDYEEKKIYLQQLYYGNLYNSDNIVQVLMQNNVQRHTYIYTDHNETQINEDLLSRRYNIHLAEKDVYNGIMFCKGFTICIVEGSKDLLKQYRSYHWKQDRYGNSLNAPVKHNDHFPDAGRYAAYTDRKPVNQILVRPTINKRQLR